VRPIILEDRPLPSFFCRNKKPTGPHGFLDATTDPIAFAALPSGPQVGVATGAVSGIDVLDIDPRKGGDRWFHENRAQLPLTRVHETPSGGLHLIFRHSPGLRCSNSKIARGIDIKADGGYVIWWPACCCRVLVEGPIAELPQLLLLSSTSAVSLPAGGEAGKFSPTSSTLPALVAEDFPASSQVNGKGMGVPAKSDCDGFKVTPIPPLEAPIDYEINYARRALGNAFRELRACPAGCRNATLNALAYKMGRLVARGWITCERVETLLLEASEECGLLAADGLGQCKATINSGMRAGMTRPYHDIRQRVAS
jgi:hypothetical protein